MKTLKDLFLDQLADMYDAEQRIAVALPKMIGSANSPGLKQVFQSYLQENAGHLKKLEKVFGCFNEKARVKTCAATKGLLEEGEEIMSAFQDTPAINEALISVAQKFEYYRIASYGCLREWAGLLGNKNAAAILQKILSEKGPANKSLTIMARSSSKDNTLMESEDIAFKDMPADGEESATEHLGIRPELQSNPIKN